MVTLLPKLPELRQLGNRKMFVEHLFAASTWQCNANITRKNLRNKFRLRLRDVSYNRRDDINFAFR